MFDKSIGEETKKLGKVYLHVSNGGVTFKVKDTENLGVMIIIETSSVGNLINKQKILTNREGLLRLSEMFKNASENCQYEKEYCYCAEYHIKSKRS